MKKGKDHTDRTFENMLIRRYAPDTPAETIEYINANPDECFSESLVEELDEIIGFRVRNAVQYASETLAYHDAHQNDLVSLDVKTKEMKFNDCRVPAYWYRKKLSRKKINEQLEWFRKIWMKLGFPKQIRYPLLESYFTLEEWIAEYGDDDDFFGKAERDLECMDTEEARQLYVVLNRCPYLSQIRNHYPFRIRKIIKIENRISDVHLRQADLTLRLNDGRQCRIRAYASESGGYRGMSALGRKGFPMMSETDERLIVHAVIENGQYQEDKDK